MVCVTCILNVVGKYSNFRHNFFLLVPLHIQINGKPSINVSDCVCMFTTCCNLFHGGLLFLLTKHSSLQFLSKRLRLRWRAAISYNFFIVPRIGLQKKPNFCTREYKSNVMNELLNLEQKVNCASTGKASGIELEK